jgi:hypothetical protein
MARRWPIEEEKALREVRKRLQKELNQQTPFPEGKKVLFLLRLWSVQVDSCW